MFAESQIARLVLVVLTRELSHRSIDRESLLKKNKLQFGNSTVFLNVFVHKECHIYESASPSNYLRGIHARGLDKKQKKTNMQASLLKYIRGYTLTLDENLPVPKQE